MARHQGFLRQAQDDRKYKLSPNGAGGVLFLERPHGLALIVGMLGALVTMAVHPTHFDRHASADALAEGMRILVAVHGLLMLPLLVFGFAGLTRAIGWQRPPAQLAFIVYCLAATALMLAAIADGFLNAALMPQLAAGDSAARAMTMAITRYNMQVNAACAQVFVAGSSIAILLWSLPLGRFSGSERHLGRFGLRVSLLTLTALLSGHLRMSAHGFGLVMVLQAAWGLATAQMLLRIQRPEFMPMASTIE